MCVFCLSCPRAIFVPGEWLAAKDPFSKYRKGLTIARIFFCLQVGGPIAGGGGGGGVISGGAYKRQFKVLAELSRATERAQRSTMGKKMK